MIVKTGFTNQYLRPLNKRELLIINFLISGMIQVIVFDENNVKNVELHADFIEIVQEFQIEKKIN